MSSDAIQRLRTIIENSGLLKAEALNRDDPRFQPWHEKAREAVVENAPVKRFAFDEIPFASDFFLSKTIAEREDINDRIALVSDFQLAVRLLEDVVEIAEKEHSRKKREALREEVRRGSEPDAGGRSQSGWEGIFGKVESAGFSGREKEEVREVLGNLRSVLQGPERDWDRFKRGVKFLLDFDRGLALETVPFLLETFQCASGRQND